MKVKVERTIKTQPKAATTTAAATLTKTVEEDDEVTTITTTTATAATTRTATTAQELDFLPDMSTTISTTTAATITTTATAARNLIVSKSKGYCKSITTNVQCHMAQFQLHFPSKNKVTAAPEYPVKTSKREWFVDS